MTTKLDGAAEQYFARKESRAKARLKVDLLRSSSTVPSQIDLRSTYPGASEVLDAPFGYSPTSSGNIATAGLDSGYFFGLLNAFTHAAVMTKIDELRAHPERDLLLPKAQRAVPRYTRQRNDGLFKSGSCVSFCPAGKTQ